MGMDKNDVIEGTVCSISYIVNGCSEPFSGTSLCPGVPYSGTKVGFCPCPDAILQG